jgi:hypothetical protein
MHDMHDMTTITAISLIMRQSTMHDSPKMQPAHWWLLFFRLAARQRGPGRELFSEDHAHRLQVMGVRHAGDGHVNFAGPLAGTKKHSRAALRTEPSFRLGARPIPVKKVRPSIDAELIGRYANPAYG